MPFTQFAINQLFMYFFEVFFYFETFRKLRKGNAPRLGSGRIWMI